MTSQLHSHSLLLSPTSVEKTSIYIAPQCKILSHQKPYLPRYRSKKIILMNPTWGDASARLIVDGMIMLKRAQFILQIHLRRALRKEMREERKLTVPRLKLQPYLDNIIPKRHQMVEPGLLQCRGYEARLWRFDITIKAHGDHENFVLQADWEQVC